MARRSKIVFKSFADLARGAEARSQEKEGKPPSAAYCKGWHDGCQAIKGNNPWLRSDPRFAEYKKGFKEATAETDKLTKRELNIARDKVEFNDEIPF